MPKCIHNRSKYYCKDCGGGAYCQHSKHKIYCKECDGRGLCEHENRKYSCMICNTSKLCIHNKNKYYCKECKGNGICEHNKQRSRCKECHGSQICIHDRDKQRCTECGSGSQICIHKKWIQQCIECAGVGICEHKRRKDMCKICLGNSLCIHKVNKYQCSKCRSSSSYCEHDKQKRDCKECGGSRLCKSEWCHQRSIKKYCNYCFYCYVNMFPDVKIARNYKTKENTVKQFINTEYPEYKWKFDTIIKLGSSHRRPDIFVDVSTHIIIIEIDEDQHNHIQEICENRRLMEISRDLNHRPITVIRFNPDSYIDISGNKINSCWRCDSKGNINISNTKKIEWNDRLNQLKKRIDFSLINSYDKTLHIEYLFYDCNKIEHL